MANDYLTSHASQVPAMDAQVMCEVHADEEEVSGSDASDTDNDESSADNAAADNGQPAVGGENEDGGSEADAEAEQQDS